jgi:hypothetical protein
LILWVTHGDAKTMNPSTTTAHKFDAKTCRAFVRRILDPSIGCTEFRVFKADVQKGWIVPGDIKYGMTIGGWYDRIDMLAAACSKLKGISGYVTINPVSKELLRKRCNEFGRINRNEGTADEHIVCLRWIYLDIDAERISGSSSTDSELDQATQLRDIILSTETGIRERSVWGKSGNGAYILLRLPDWPVDKVHRDHAENIIKTFARKYNRINDLKSHIDSVVFNPARIMVIPGTLKCKGADRPESPWRLATVDGAYGTEFRL